jgi:hypothetical protein
MNRGLYLLTGGCVGVAIIAAFFGKVDTGKLSPNEILVATLLGVAYVAVCLFFLCVRQGKAWRASFDRKCADADDEVRLDIRDKGKVRQPPWDIGPVP